MVGSPLLPRWVQLNTQHALSHISNLVYLCCRTERQKQSGTLHSYADQGSHTNIQNFQGSSSDCFDASWFHSWMSRFKPLLQPSIYSPTFNIHKPLKPRFGDKSTPEHHWVTSGFVLGLRKSCGAHQSCSAQFVNHFWDQTWIIRKLNMHLYFLKMCKNNYRGQKSEIIRE